MEKKYDIWIDYDYEGWDYEFGLDSVDLEKATKKHDNADRRYFVYESAALVMEG